MEAVKFCFLFLALLLVSSCSDRKLDTTKVREAMKAREVRVVPEAKIIERTLFLGDSLIQNLDATAAIKQSGSLFKTWQQNDMSVEVSAFSIDANPDLAEKEVGVFQAYQYNAENGLSADPNAQKLPGEIMAYNAPILDNGKIIGMWSLHIPVKWVVISLNKD